MLYIKVIPVLDLCYLIKFRQYKILPGFVFVYYGNNEPNIFATNKLLHSDEVEHCKPMNAMKA
jgi:hypothetical protein